MNAGQVVVRFLGHQVGSQFADLLALLHLAQVALQVFGEHFIAVEFVPLGLEELLYFGERGEMDGEEGIVGEDGVNLVDFPNLLELRLVILLISNGDEVGHP